MQKLRLARVEGCLRLRSQAPWARKRARKSTPCAVPLGSGLPPPRGNGRLGQGPAEKNPDREFEGSGPGGSGMEVVASLTPKPRGSPVQGAVHSTLLTKGREAGAARSGAGVGVQGEAGRRRGPRPQSRLQGGRPCRTEGGRLTPAAERLHGEDAPPAQHGPAPPRPQPPDRALPARVPPPRSHRGLARASGPPGCGPRTLPAGGGMRRDGGGEGRRCKGAGLHSGPRGAGRG